MTLNSESRSQAVDTSGDLPQKDTDYARLIYHKSDGSIVQKNVLRTTTMIGAHPASNLQLLSSQVSEMHCMLTLDGRGFRVWDLRSETGTFVNGLKIRSSRLKDGDELTIGSFIFRLETNLEDDTRHGFFIDDYRVLGILGTGGMGWLYVVEDPRTCQKLALKVLMRRADHPGVMQEELRLRFLLEGKAGNRLKHPNIVDVLDYQQRADVEYMLLELFESINLQELVQRDGPLEPALVCHIGAQSALALSHIHSLGSVHRDVKPSNILVNGRGATKVCDFGLVFLGDDPAEEFLAEQMGNDCLGTADYVSPEQTYNSYQIDGRADLYSLGCSLYTALTARLPFPQEKSRDKILAQRNQNPIPIRQHRPEVPIEIAEIVEKCLEKSPEKRFQSADDLATALFAHARSKRVHFDFEKLLRQRTQQAGFRLADPRKKHYLQRIPANVVTSLHMTNSQDHYENDQVTIATPMKSEIPTHLPGDTSGATQTE